MSTIPIFRKIVNAFRYKRHPFPTILFFAPHQDDELLTLGIHACQLMKSGANIHAFLCTDGSKSGVRKALCNGKSCSLHKGIHEHSLTTDEFVAARDREFAKSCTSLGYDASSVHVSPNRCVDGNLTVDSAKTIILDALSQFPDAKCVCTISPFGGSEQHPDHTHLGEAALQLFEDGHFPELYLFIEPYCIDSSQKTYPGLKLNTIHADMETVKKLEKAVQAYSIWDPSNHSYAIGKHSVPKSFDDFLKDPISYFHICK